MARHAGKIEVESPGQRVKRTFLAVGSVALVLLGVLPSIINIVVEEVGGHLPEGLVLWLGGAAVVVTAAATAVTRIMAIPVVNGWLAKLNAASVPKEQLPE